MARKLKVDMTGVESYSRCPEGEHVARLKKIELATIQGSGDDGLKAQFEVIKGEGKGNIVYETFSLGEKALWKLKSFLEAIGLAANGRMNLDLDKLEGKVCIIDVIHDEYNGSKRAKISAYIKLTNADGDDEDEDDEELDEEKTPKKPAKKTPAKKPAKKPEPEPEEDEDEEDDEDEDDEDEEEEEPVKKPAKKTPTKKAPEKKAPAKKSPKKTEPEDDDDDWEDDDE